MPSTLQAHALPDTAMLRLRTVTYIGFTGILCFTKLPSIYTTIASGTVPSPTLTYHTKYILFYTVIYKVGQSMYLSCPIWKETPALASPQNNLFPALSTSISKLKFWLPLNTGSSMISRTTSSNRRVHILRSWSPSAGPSRMSKHMIRPS